MKFISQIIICIILLTSCQKNNQVAVNLYRKLGFCIAEDPKSEKSLFVFRLSDLPLHQITGPEGKPPDLHHCRYCEAK